ncbi:hypothetical protein Pse7367_2714 [Thalassoporum mexicanum PCC 7367]|uniref:helix-turn-helix transcriptional regulator n=1 Tax=Thalassoporum mexicanum TaxID=3457544 RepID=UPI00029F909D|nr:WYL domain-containing protein [Pseudanabaena sp. PCC 7367]AFY70969.1 hypothetical protein Pse7367_2714 [Pseudanabaena sp. PCC 7367]
MASQDQKHAYRDRTAFERLLLLIAVLLKHPGIGSNEPELSGGADLKSLKSLKSVSGQSSLPKQQQAKQFSKQSAKHHDALMPVANKMQELATQLHIDLPNCSIAALRKDLRTLRQYGILAADQKFRWGYYLGTGVLQQEELKIALQTFYSLAEYQKDPKISEIYQRLRRRLQAQKWEEGKELYHSRVLFNRVITHTKTEETIEQGVFSKNLNLYHQIDRVERAIRQGECLRLTRHSNPYQTDQVGDLEIYPLQFIYYNIAWYLLFEHSDSGLLAIERVDRFADQFQVIAAQSRSLTIQRQRLKSAHKLLDLGWDLHLGNSKKEQEDELSGKLKPIKVTVRFSAQVAPFISEGDLRHPSQQVKEVKENGILTYVEYTVYLPRRSYGEFRRWVHRFMADAIIVEPTELATQHFKDAQALYKKLAALKENT